VVCKLSGRPGGRLVEGPFSIDATSGIVTLVAPLDKSRVVYQPPSRFFTYFFFCSFLYFIFFFFFFFFPSSSSSSCSYFYNFSSSNFSRLTLASCVVCLDKSRVFYQPKSVSFPIFSSVLSFISSSSSSSSCSYFYNFSSSCSSYVVCLDKSRVSYPLNVTATDNGRCCGGTTSRASRGVVVFDVKDINNNAPRFTDCSSYNPTVLEKDNVGTFVIQVRHVTSYF